MPISFGVLPFNPAVCVALTYQPHLRRDSLMDNIAAAETEISAPAQVEQELRSVRPVLVALSIPSVDISSARVNFQ